LCLSVIPFFHRKQASVITSVQDIMEAMLKTMQRLRPFRNSVPGPAPPLVPVEEREQGVFGKVTAHFSVFEAQGRGTLHAHQLLWTDLPPHLLADIAEHPELVAEVRAVIDEVCLARLLTPASGSMVAQRNILRHGRRVLAERASEFD
jgi:hypothetical protein